MRHCLITGGSSGIGLAIASILAKRGDQVSLLARDAERLAKASDHLLAQGVPADRIATVCADVSDAGSVLSGVRAAEQRFGPVDTLYASAGVVNPALFKDQSGEEFDRQIATNLCGVANAVRAVIGPMLLGNHGRIMIVSSGAALVGIPGYSAYCASKFGLRGLASALRLETATTGVTVSICFPPDTQTPQFEAEMHLRPAEAHLFMGRAKPLPVGTVAKAIVRGAESGSREVHFGVVLRCLGWFGPIVAPLLEVAYGMRTRWLKHIDASAGRNR